MLPLSPVCAAALLAIAAMAATRVERVRRFVHAWHAAPSGAPLACYLLGVVLGPALGLLDRRLLQASMPVLWCAAAWVAARAGTELGTPRDRLPHGRARGIADALAAWLVPAALLYAAMRFLPPAITAGWAPPSRIIPAIAILAASLTVASGAERRFAITVALCAGSAAFLAALPHGSIHGVPRQVVWAGIVLGGATVTVLGTRWIARLAAAPMGGVVAGLALGTGVGQATGASPLFVWALAGTALARSSTLGATVRDGLVRSEAPVAALLWVVAGAQLAGRVTTVGITAAALALWPLGRSVMVRSGAPVDRTLGLALAQSYAWSAGGPGVADPLVTAAALALLLAGALSPRGPSTEPRLTSRLTPAELSV